MTVTLPGYVLESGVVAAGTHGAAVGQSQFGEATFAKRVLNIHGPDLSHRRLPETDSEIQVGWDALGKGRQQQQMKLIIAVALEEVRQCWDQPMTGQSRCTGNP